MFLRALGSEAARADRSPTRGGLQFGRESAQAFWIPREVSQPVVIAHDFPEGSGHKCRTFRAPQMRRPAEADAVLQAVEPWPLGADTEGFVQCQPTAPQCIDCVIEAVICHSVGALCFNRYAPISLARTTDGVPDSYFDTGMRLNRLPECIGEHDGIDRDFGRVERRER